MAMTYGSARMLIEYMERCHVGCGQIAGIGACLNLNVSLLGVRMKHGSALALMLIEYMERCRDAFERTGRTLVLVHV